MEFRNKYPLENWITSKHKLYDGDIVVFERNGKEIEASYVTMDEEDPFDQFEIMVQIPGNNWLDLLDITKTIVFRKPDYLKVDSSCHHLRKYFNVISNNLKFWVCPDCKKDLGQ